MAEPWQGLAVVLQQKLLPFDPGLGWSPSKRPGGGVKGCGRRPRDELSPLSLIRGLQSKGSQHRLSLQEQGNEKTNNGTHYKLQLLYSNGERPPPSVSRCHTGPCKESS